MQNRKQKMNGKVNITLPFIFNIYLLRVIQQPE